MNIQIKILSDHKMIEAACALLHEVYISKYKWNFLSDNPSQIRIESVNNKMILIDRFVDRAVWFGAFHDDTLIGCIRLTGIDENNQFEIEKYPTDTVHKYLPLDLKDTCVEITKLAVHQKYATHNITQKLFLEIFKYCERNELSVFACTHNLLLLRFFKKIHYPLKVEYAFKYEPHDKKAVNFYYADYNKGEIKTIIENIIN